MSSEQQLTLSTCVEEGTVTIRLAGELDLSVTDVLEDRIAAEVARGQDRIVLDVSGLEFVDSTGISTFIVASKQLNARGGWLRLEGVTGVPRKALEITGVYDVLTLPGPQVDAASLAG